MDKTSFCVKTSPGLKSENSRAIGHMRRQGDGKVLRDAESGGKYNIRRGELQLANVMIPTDTPVQREISVLVVRQNWTVDRCEMYPDLMSPSGTKLGLQQGVPVNCFQKPVRRFSRFPVPALAYRNGYAPFSPGRFTGADCRIAFDDIFGTNRPGKAGSHGGIAGNQKNPGSIAVQTMYRKHGGTGLPGKNVGNAHGNTGAALYRNTAWFVYHENIGILVEHRNIFHER